MNATAWTVVAVFLALTFAVGLWFARRASKSTQEYFLSGRTLPWWIVGTSMVITTFAPDTPLGVAENVRADGVSYGWFGWNMVMGQVLAVFLFSRLWRRSGVMTDNELLELRYSGKPAAGLRLFKALHFSIVYNIITLSVVMIAIVTVFDKVADLPDWFVPYLPWTLAGIALVYAVLAGFWGVVATDFLQFWMAVGGAIVFAWIAHQDFGGVSAVAQVAKPDALAFFPDDPERRLQVIVFILIMWWGSYNADGGGYLCQRMLAAKDERHASLGTLWFSVSYAAVRMWPWVLVGSLSVVAFPALSVQDEVALVNGRPTDRVSGTVIVVGADGPEEQELRDHPLRVEGEVVRSGETGEELRTAIPPKSKATYPAMMRKVLSDSPILLGILVAAFLAAFLSTVDTLLNWGASYLVHDVFRRFVAPEASERRLVWIAKGTVVVLMGISVYCSQFFTSIRDAMIFHWAVSAGIGPVLILRWFWWRVNAWGEIWALATSITVTFGFEICNTIWLPGDYKWANGSAWIGTVEILAWQKMLIIIGLSISSAALAVAFGGKTDSKNLEAFVRKVRPPGFWGPVRARLGDEARADHSMGQVVLLWICGVAVVYGLTFGIGGLIYERMDLFWGSSFALVIGCLGLSRLLRMRASDSAP